MALRKVHDGYRLRSVRARTGLLCGHSEGNLDSCQRSNGVELQRRFNRFWWMPAWKVHRRAFPKSSLRRQIVTRFAITFALVVVSTIFMGLGVLQRGVVGR